MIALLWANCQNYTLGIFKSREDWSYIFSDAYGGVRLKIALSAVGVIATTGLFGKFSRGSYCQYKVSVSHFFTFVSFAIFVIVTLKFSAKCYLIFQLIIMY